MSDLQQYLAQYGDMLRSIRKGSEWKYSCVEDYIAKNGTAFSSAELTDEEFEIVSQAAGTAKYPIKQCFGNSQRLVVNDTTGKLIYIEGFVSRIIPIHHGWVAINGKVIDLTIRHESCLKLHRYKRFKDRVLGVLPKAQEYIGVAFSKEAILESMRTTGMYQSLIDNWQEHWPLLKGIKICLQ